MPETPSPPPTPLTVVDPTPTDSFRLVVRSQVCLGRRGWGSVLSSLSPLSSLPRLVCPLVCHNPSFIYRVLFLFLTSPSLRFSTVVCPSVSLALSLSLPPRTFSVCGPFSFPCGRLFRSRLGSSAESLPQSTPLWWGPGVNHESKEKPFLVSFVLFTCLVSGVSGW